nr:MAG TPA: hypothetical protein [Caudoviricetes sp.]
MFLNLTPTLIAALVFASYNFTFIKQLIHLYRFYHLSLHFLNCC